MAKAWIEWERKVSSMLRGGRSVLSRGVDVTSYVGDIRIGVSCKYGIFGIRKKDLQEISILCKEHRYDISVLATKERGGKYELVTMPLEDFAKILDTLRDKEDICNGNK